MKNTYPKVMWVWDNSKGHAHKSEVIGEIQAYGVKYYITYNNDATPPICWKNAKDIEEPIEEPIGMKTPIQEFFEFMHQNQYFIGNDLLAKYKELLEKEKEVIAKAYNCTNSMAMNGEQYYNETFNTKEK